MYHLGTKVGIFNWHDTAFIWVDRSKGAVVLYFYFLHAQFLFFAELCVVYSEVLRSLRTK